MLSCAFCFCYAVFSTESWHQRYNFWPHHITTDVPFSMEERAVLPHMGFSRSWAATSSQSAEVVLRSLTKNARDVFRVVCECQLEQLKAPASREDDRDDGSTQEPGECMPHTPVPRNFPGWHFHSMNAKAAFVVGLTCYHACRGSCFDELCVSV